MQSSSVSTPFKGFGKDYSSPVSNNFNLGSFSSFEYLSWLQSSIYSPRVTSNAAYDPERSVTSLVNDNSSRNLCIPRASTSGGLGTYGSSVYSDSNLMSTFSAFLSRVTANPYGSLPYITHALPENSIHPTSSIQRPGLEYSSFIYQKQIWQQTAVDMQNLMAVERCVSSKSIYSFLDARKDLLANTNANFLQQAPMTPTITSQFLDESAYTPPPSPTSELDGHTSPIILEQLQENTVLCSDEDSFRRENSYNPQKRRYRKRTKLDLNLGNSEKTFYICKWETCAKRFSRYVNLLSHERTHYEERLFICMVESCGKRYKYQHQLKQHEYSHRRKKPFICRWQNCKKSYKSLGQYMRHEQTHVPPAGLHSKECEDNSFENSQNRSRLKKFPRIALNQPIFVCKKKSCGKSFKRLYHLRKHEMTHRRKNTTRTAKYYGKSYKSINNLQRKTPSVSKERTFACTWDSCDKKYARRDHLKRHERIHTGESFTCESPSCGKSFFRTDHLRNHQYKHSDTHFKCKLCPKRYTRPDHLKRHERIHTGESFICESPHCEKRFFRPDHLRQHQYTHAVKNIFKCEFCQKKFKRLDVLRAHEKTHRSYNGVRNNRSSDKLLRSNSYNNRSDRDGLYKTRSRSRQVSQS